MLAKAFAKESKLPYYEISGAKLFEIEYIKEVYETASKHAPCVVILDNIDIKGIIQGSVSNVPFSDISKADNTKLGSSHHILYLINLLIILYERIEQFIYKTHVLSI